MGETTYCSLHYAVFQLSHSFTLSYIMRLSRVNANMDTLIRNTKGDISVQIGVSLPRLRRGESRFVVDI